MLRAGSLDIPATVYTVTEGKDSVRGVTLTNAEFGTAWIEITPLSGSEQVNSLATTGTVMSKIRMRYMEGLKPKMRIVADGKTYEIMSVISPGRNEMHEVMVMEVAD